MVDTGAAVAIALGSALLGALTAGLLQVLLVIWDRNTRKRVAARLVLGDIYVAEKVFELLIERSQWWDIRPDFDAAVATWGQVRTDFAAAVSMADWAEVDAFYGNLARSAALWRPGGEATPSDLRVAKELVEYAGAAQIVAAKHTTKWLHGWRERHEVVARLGRQEGARVPEEGTAS